MNSLANLEGKGGGGGFEIIRTSRGRTGDKTSSGTASINETVDPGTYLAIQAATHGAGGLGGETGWSSLSEVTSTGGMAEITTLEEVVGTYGWVSDGQYRLSKIVVKQATTISFSASAYRFPTSYCFLIRV